MKVLKFYKEEDNRWYIFLPQYPGNKEDLEMVCGADTLLDLISKGKNEVRCIVSDYQFQANYKLEKIRNTDEIGGALYKLISEKANFEVWLCEVTKFVFEGNLPNNLWIS